MDFVWGKTPFLSPFSHFFKKIELFRRKTVRINIFPGGIKNSAKIGQKKRANLILPKKSVKIGKKKGVRFGQNSIFEPIFTFFQKIDLFRRKTVRIKIFPEGKKKFGQNRPKKKGQSHFAQKG